MRLFYMFVRKLISMSHVIEHIKNNTNLISLENLQ